MLYWFLAIFLGLYGIYCLIYWKMKGIPRLPVKFPFLSPFYLIEGVMVVNRTNMVEQYHKIKALGHRYAGVTTFFRGVLIITDLQLIRELLIRNSEFFDDRGFFHTDMFGPVIHKKITLDGENWIHMKSILNPSVLCDKLRSLFQNILNISPYLVEAIEDCATENRDIDVKELLACYTTDVILYHSYKINCYSYRHSRSKFCKCTVDRLNDLGLRTADKKISNWLYRIVRNYLKYREAGNYRHFEFFSLCSTMEEWSTKEEEEPLVHHEMFRKLFLFFYGSFDVTSTTLRYAIYELCQNLDIQEKARDEIHRILEESDGEVTWPILNDMTYLDQIINETLRLYPPSPNIVKRCERKGCQLSDANIKISTLTDVVVPLFSLHRDPKFLADPERFDPERFNPDKQDKNPPFFMPYGEGLKEYTSIQACMIQTKVGLVQILKNFKLTTSPNTRLPLRLQPQAFLRCYDTLYIKAEKL